MASTYKIRALCIVLCAGIAIAADPVAQMFGDAAAALSAGDYATAEKGFLLVLKYSPNHVGALGNLGVVYSRTERLDRAIAVYRRALRLSPSDPGLLLNLGLAYMKQESYAAALPVFRTLVTVSPRGRQARQLLATSELYTGGAAAAVRSFETLRAEDPGDIGLLYLLGVGYLKQNQAEKARQVLDEFLSAAPPIQASLVLCKAYYESTRFEEAAGQCRQALKADPHFAGAHRELGKVLVSQRSPDAVKELAIAIEQDANDSEALYFLGGALLQDDRIAEATPYLERARRLNPGFWGNYYYLGRANLQSNHAAEAVTLLEKAAELNSSESAVFYQLGRALKATGKTQQANRAMARVRELKTLELKNNVAAAK